MDGKITLFLFAALVAVCYAQQKCCIPDQFEILAGRTFSGVKAGVPQTMQIGEQIAFDYPNRRRAQIVDVNFGGGRYTEQSILDYKNGVQYDFILHTTGCRKSPLKGPMQHCLPDNAMYGGVFYAGNSQLLENVYSFPVNVTSFQYVGNLTLTVTRDGCIPIGGVFVGSLQGVPLLESFGLANYTKGIKNPARYFTVPEKCHTSSIESPFEKIPTRMIPFWEF